MGICKIFYIKIINVVYAPCGGDRDTKVGIATEMEWPWYYVAYG